MRFLVFAAAAGALIAPSAFAMPAGAQATPAPAATVSADAQAKARRLYDQARGDFKLQRYKDAIGLLDQVVALDPSAARAYVLRGDSKDELGDNRAALADYDAAIALAPDYAYAYSTRCDTKRELDDLRGALGDCNKAIALDATDAQTFENKGNVELGPRRLRAGRPRLHEGHLARRRLLASVRRALRGQTRPRRPRRRDRRLRSGRQDGFHLPQRLLLPGSGGDRPETLRGRCRGLHVGHEASPGHVAAYYYRGIAHLKNGDLDAALADANAYVAAVGGDPDGIRLRGEVYAARNDTAKAVADLTVALNAYRNAGDARAAETVQQMLDKLGAAKA